MKRCLPLFVAAAGMCLSGCVYYQYRIVQPAAGAPPVTDKPVAIHYEPLDYRLWRDRDRLAMSIVNPTDDRIVLVGNRSYVIDPQGETHPVRDRVMGPHSFIRIYLPPIPFTYAYPDYWGWGPGWGWGWYDPFWGPGWGPGFYGPPPVSYYQVLTGYDWRWKTGPARLRLTYDRNGKFFEHDFELIREQQK
jgi:hypothetical protein